MGIQNYLPLTLVDLVNVQELLAPFLTCPFVKMQLGKLTIFDSQEKKKGGRGVEKGLAWVQCCRSTSGQIGIEFPPGKWSQVSHSYQLHKQQKNAYLAIFSLGWWYRKPVIRQHFLCCW